MRRRIFFLLLTAALLILAVGSVQAQHTRPFKMTLSGTGSIPLGSELNGHALSLSLCGGKSNLPGGSFECTTTGYSVLEPPEGFEFDTPNCPGGLEMEQVESVTNHIVRFATGDVSYWVPDPNGDAYICAYENHMTFLSSWLLVGGSGPYEGATGNATFYGRADPLPLGDPLGEYYLMVGFHPSISEGTITFAE